MERISSHKCFGGTVSFNKHFSAANNCEMRFAVFEPAQAADKPVPALTYLAGLTCTEETFITKGGAIAHAAEYGLMLIAPDTSPRGEDVPDDPDGAWDFGLGAGFYVNATQDPWKHHYQMADYVTNDLQAVIKDNFNIDEKKQGIFGHSMGGHGALTLGLKNPTIYTSISAFAPICAPMSCPWGEKALSNYLGSDKESWKAYDASYLVAQMKNAKDSPKILIDQGLADQFLDTQLKPELLEEAAKKSGYPLAIRCFEGYDHGYYFISSVMADHIKHHALCLR